MPSPRLRLAPPGRLGRPGRAGSSSEAAWPASPGSGGRRGRGPSLDPCGEGTGPARPGLHRRVRPHAGTLVGEMARRVVREAGPPGSGRSGQSAALRSGLPLRDAAPDRALIDETAPGQTPVGQVPRPLAGPRRPGAAGPLSAGVRSTRLGPRRARRRLQARAHATEMPAKLDPAWTTCRSSPTPHRRHSDRARPYMDKVPTKFRPVARYRAGPRWRGTAQARVGEVPRRPALARFRAGPRWRGTAQARGQPGVGAVCSGRSRQGALARVRRVRVRGGAG
jgi:hypothetical protein